MKRIFLIMAALLCLTATASAQRYLSLDLALQTALDDINQRLGTTYTWDDGQVAFLYEELVVEGDNLGCPVVARTNQNSYYVTVIQFDTELDNIYEWEHRLAYDEDGNIRMVLCDAPPGGTRGPGVNTTPQPTNTATVTPSSTPTPTLTPTPPPVLIGRDGARVLPPLICDGLPTRLIVGSTGRVIVGDVSNNLRQSPDLQSPQVGDLFGGAIFTVVDGPVCNDDIAWYAVEDDGEVLGWTAEGRRGDYFVEPVLTDASRLLPSNVAVMQPVGVLFAFGAVGLTAPHAGYMVTYSAGTSQVWTIPQDIFTPLAGAAWQPSGPELPGQLNYVHRDWTGRIWRADALTGTLSAVEDLGTAPFSLPVIGGTPVLAIDMESRGIAVQGTSPNSIQIYSIDTDGGGNQAEASLALNGALRDLAFWPDGTGLYAATDTEIALFTYELGDGWGSVPVTIFTHDLTNPKLATSIDGRTVAITGLRTDGLPGLRAYSVNLANFSNITVTAGTALNGEAGTNWSRPSLSPEGALAAFTTSQGTVRVADAFAGAALVEFTTGSFGPVAFSMDGLVLIAPAPNQQLQMYGVAIPDDTVQVTASPGFSVVTATPTFGPMVVTATPTFGPMVVTATPTFDPFVVVTSTPTDAPTLGVPPTAQQ